MAARPGPSRPAFSRPASPNAVGPVSPVINVIEERVAALTEYARIPIAFEVSEVFDVVAEADGSVQLEGRRGACVLRKGLRRHPR